jgi:hypothetical protein
LPSALLIYLERIKKVAKKGPVVHGRNISNLKLSYDIDLFDKSYERL